MKKPLLITLMLIICFNVCIYTIFKTSKSTTTDVVSESNSTNIPQENLISNTNQVVEQETTKIFYNIKKNKVILTCVSFEAFHTSLHDSLVEEIQKEIIELKPEMQQSCNQEHIAGKCIFVQRQNGIPQAFKVFTFYSNQNKNYIYTQKEKCANNNGEWINGSEFPYEEITASSFYNAFHNNALAAKKKFDNGFYVFGTFDRITYISNIAVLQLKANSYNEILIGGLNQEFLTNLKSGYQYKFFCKSGDYSGIFVTALQCIPYASRQYSLDDGTTGVWKMYE